MTVAFTNFASTTLNGGITALATSMTVAVTTGANFPATAGGAWFYIVLTDSLVSPTQREVIKVTTRSGDGFTVCVRARDGTTALAWPSGTYCQLRLTAGTFADLTVQYANNADNLSNLASAATARTNLGLGSMATQVSSAVAITGGTIDGVTFTSGAYNGTLGATTPSTIAATTISASGQITSTLAIGTAPFVVTSTTVVANLNVSQLLGLTWTAPGTIGSGTPSSGAFTTLSASGAVSGVGFSNYLASPPAIGGSVPAAGSFTAIIGTTIRASTYINYRGGDNASTTNSGFGETALDSNSGGINNTAIGYASLTANVAGINNTAVGASSLVASNASYYNTSIGASSMSSSIAPQNSVAVGYLSLQNVGKTVTAGSFYVGIDYIIQSSGTTNFVAVGAADNNIGTIFTSTGAGSGTGTAASITLGNVGVGYQALNSVVNGQWNVAVGRDAGYNITVGGQNSILGDFALSGNISGGTNVAVGANALLQAGAQVSAGAFIVGNSYTINFVGSTNFVAIGAAASNIGITFTATGVGAGTGTATANANSNTAVGFNAGSILLHGKNNTIVGSGADVTSTNQTNSTAIGYQATATADNQMMFGNASVTANVFHGSISTSGRALGAQGAAVASANNLTLGADGNYFQITGATQINLLVSTNWTGGSEVTLKFNSTPTVKHNQGVSGVNKPILLAGAADFVATANDTLSLIYDSTDAVWYETSRAVI